MSWNSSWGHCIIYPLVIEAEGYLNRWKKKDFHEVSANICGWALHSFSTYSVIFPYKLPKHPQTFHASNWDLSPCRSVSKSLWCRTIRWIRNNATNKMEASIWMLCIPCMIIISHFTVHQLCTILFFYWRYNPLWVCILQPSSGL